MDRGYADIFRKVPPCSNPFQVRRRIGIKSSGLTVANFEPIRRRSEMWIERFWPLVMWLRPWPRVTTPGASREATPRVFEQRSVSARSPVATSSVSQRANERCVSPPRRNPPRRRPFFAASHKRDNWPHQATSGVPSPGARATHEGRRRARDSYGASYACTDVRSSCFRREGKRLSNPHATRDAPILTATCPTPERLFPQGSRASPTSLALTASNPTCRPLPRRPASPWRRP